MTSPTSDRRQGLVGNTPIKAPVDCATTGNIVLSGEQVIDSVQTAGSRVLVWKQTDATQNGIYDSSSAGWTRSNDCDGSYDLTTGTMVYVTGGTLSGNTWLQVTTAKPFTIGSSLLTWIAAFFGSSSVISYIASGVGAIARAVQNKLREWPSALDFNAVGDGVTLDTAAMIAATTASPFVYLPAGKTFLVGNGVNYWQCYGPGTLQKVGETYAVNAFPRTGAPAIAYNNLTFGTYENAVGASFTINGSQAQTKTNTQVNGTSGSGLATPVGQQRDHVGLFVSAFAPTPISTGASSTYTTTTMTATELVGLTTIKPGMVADTKHGTPYTGTIQSFNSGTGTITVDSWWLNGGVPVAGTPANGTGAKVNPVTVTFGANIVVSSTSTGTDVVSGLEIDVAANNATGAATSIGIDFVGLGTSTALAAGRARGTFVYGYFAQGAGIGTGFFSQGTGGGFLAADVAGTSYGVQVSGVLKWAINSIGQLQNDYRTTVVNAAATFTIPASAATVINVSGGAVLTLPATSAGLNIKIIGNAGCTVKNASATTIATVAAGASRDVGSDGSFWY